MRVSTARRGDPALDGQRPDGLSKDGMGHHLIKRFALAAPAVWPLIATTAAADGLTERGGSAVGAPNTADAAPPGTLATTHYGWQIVLVDAYSVLVGVATGSDMGFVIGYLAGSPIVHSIHGNGWQAAGSVALRLALPLTGVGVEEAIGSCSEDAGRFCSAFGYRIGAVIGMGAAAAIDWIFLAKKQRARPEGTAFQLGPVQAVPAVMVTDGVLRFGATGAF